MWQANWLGEDSLPGVPNKTDSVVHHCFYSFPGVVLWGAASHRATHKDEVGQAFLLVSH